MAFNMMAGVLLSARSHPVVALVFLIIAGEVNARSMLWSKHRRRHLDHTHQLWRHVLRHEAILEDGEASFQDGTLVATWRFQVPTWGRDDAPAFGRRGAIAEMLGFYKDMDFWELEIDMPLSRHLRLDSRMRLDIDFVSPHLAQNRGA